MKTFNYGKSYKIIFWGCQFDSMLELKYAISIMNDYEFLRSRVVVYYDPKTKMPSNYIREGIKRYTPDFLIRHKITGEAIWVEVKPRAFTNTAELSLRKEVADNYIKWKKIDWKYKVVYDDDKAQSGTMEVIQGMLRVEIQIGLQDTFWKDEQPF